MADQAAADPIAAMLERVPEDAALYLRDVIRGLEAEAGNARAQARELHAALNSDIVRLRMHSSGIQHELRVALHDLAQARQEASEAQLELAEMRTELLTMRSGRRGRLSR